MGRITVNLAPADRKKEGSVYDLSVLIAILLASDQIKAEIDNAILLGEVALDGKIREVNGVLAMAITAKQNGITDVFVPVLNATEAAVVEGLNVYAVETVQQVIEHINGTKLIEKTVNTDIFSGSVDNIPDFSDVRGQIAAKKALVMKTNTL